MIVASKSGTSISDIEVIFAPQDRASGKPEAIYELLEKTFEDYLKLDLFARYHNRKGGWISIGNEFNSPYKNNL